MGPGKLQSFTMPHMTGNSQATVSVKKLGVPKLVMLGKKVISVVPNTPKFCGFLRSHEATVPMPINKCNIACQELEPATCKLMVFLLIENANV